MQTGAGRHIHTTPEGEANTKTVKWFGFRLHLIADAVYELPVDFTVTKALVSEVKETEKLLGEMKEKKPQKIERCRYFLADRGYDSTELIEWLETDKGIFTRVVRNSKKWKRLYAMRSGIERMNGIDRDFKFEKHTVRELEKMEMFLTVTFVVSLTLAKAKTESGMTKGLSGLYA